MKFRNQARLCLASFGFETHIMLSLCLTFHTRLSVWEKFNSMWLRIKISVNLFLMISIDL